jgi:hypothetical protein
LHFLRYCCESRFLRFLKRKRKQAAKDRLRRGFNFELLAAGGAKVAAFRNGGLFGAAAGFGRVHLLAAGVGDVQLNHAHSSFLSCLLV